jgi:hypothetical protein
VHYFDTQINYFRTFDVGSEIDLTRAENVLDREIYNKFKLKKSSRAIVIEEVPLVLTIGSWIQTILGVEYPIQALAKVWAFGTISINFRITVPQKINLKDLKVLVNFIESDADLEELALAKLNNLCQVLSPAISHLQIWDQYEDYLIVHLTPEKGVFKNYKEILEIEDIYEVILTEKNITVSDQIKNAIRSDAIQYSDKEICVIEWNSALICAETMDAHDISDVIEFALCQMLELRYYDEVLDKKLNTLYNSIQSSKQSIFKNNYAPLAQDASLIYIEISKIIEKIENSFKVIGDFYYARIFRAALERFRTKDWQQSVDTKLNNLANISTIFTSDTNEKRNQIMEIIIIVLIAIEVIPFLYNLIK